MTSPPTSPPARLPISLPASPAAPAGTVGPRDWHDGPVAVVGSGPSLEGLDLSDLLFRRFRAVVAVKAAGFGLPGADACVCADHRWLRRPLPFAELAPPLFLAVDDDWRGELPPRATRLRRWPQRDDLGELSPDPGALAFGGTSGFAGLNFAVLRGARDVTLFGFDYGHAPDGRHHADPSFCPWYRPAEARFWPYWREPFDLAAPRLAALGVRVRTAVVRGVRSGLTAFPTMEFGLAPAR